MTERLPYDVAVVVTDALVAACDDVGPVLTRMEGARLAEALLYHLAVLGYWVIEQDAARFPGGKLSP